MCIEDSNSKKKKFTKLSLCVCAWNGRICILLIKVVAVYIGTRLMGRGGGWGGWAAGYGGVMIYCGHLSEDRLYELHIVKCVISITCQS